MTMQGSLDLERLQQRLAEDDLATAAAELRQLLPADQAGLLRELPPPDQARVLAAVSAAQLGSLLDYLIPEGPEGIEALLQLPTEVLTTVLDQAPPGTAARLLRLFPDEQRVEVLATLREGEAVKTLIAQEEETAGALVTTEFVALRAGMTAEEAVRVVRRTRPLSEKLGGLFVVDHSDRLVGSVSFRDLLLAAPRTPLTLIMDRSAISVPAGTPQEECARLIEHYHLATLPVVGEDGKLLGFIDPTDVLAVAEGEATEDMYKMVGLSAEESVTSPLRTSLRRRIPWLALNLVTAFLAASVVGAFESTIAKAAILAAFLPVVAGQGGNATIQTVTIIVRSIALGGVTFRNARRVLWKEAALGVVHGLTIGAMAGLAGFIWTRDPLLATALSVAMVFNMVAAGLAGVLIPLGLKAAGMDPALASGVFATTVTDVLGFFFLLGLATLLLSLLGV